METEEATHEPQSNFHSNSAILRLERKLAQCEAKRKGERRFYNEFIQNMKFRYVSRLEALDKSHKELLIHANGLLEKCSIGSDPQIKAAASILKSKCQEFSEFSSKDDFVSQIHVANRQHINMLASSDSLMLSMADSIKPKEPVSISNAHNMAQNKGNHNQMVFHSAKSYHGIGNLTLTESEVVVSSGDSQIRMSKNSNAPIFPSPKNASSTPPLQRADTTQSLTIEPIEIREIQTKLSAILGAHSNEMEINETIRELEEIKRDRDSQVEMVEKLKSELSNLSQINKSLSEKVDLWNSKLMSSELTLSKASEAMEESEINLRKNELSEISESMAENLAESQVAESTAQVLNSRSQVENSQVSESKLMMAELAKATRTISELELAQSEQLGRIEEMTMEKETLEQELQKLKEENLKLKKEIEKGLESSLRKPDQSNNETHDQVEMSGVGSIQIDLNFEEGGRKEEKETEMFTMGEEGEEVFEGKTSGKRTEKSKQSKMEETEENKKEQIQKEHDESKESPGKETGRSEVETTNQSTIGNGSLAFVDESQARKIEELKSALKELEEDKEQLRLELEQIQKALREERQSHLRTKEELNATLENIKRLEELAKSNQSTNGVANQENEKERERKLQELEKTQQEQSAEIESMRKRLADSEGANKEKEEKLKNLEGETDILKEKLEENQKESEKLKEEISKAKGMIWELEDEKRKQEEMAKESHQQAIEKLQNDLAASHAENKELIQMLSASMKELEELAKECELLRNRKDLPEDQQKPVPEVNQLKETVSVQKNQLMEFEDRLRFAASENEAMKKRYFLLQDDLLRGSEINQALNETILMMKSQESREREQVPRESELMGEEDQRRPKNKEEKTAGRAKAPESKEKELREEMERVKEERDSAQVKLGTLEKELREIRGKLEEEKGENAKKTKETEELKREIRVKESQLGSLQKEMNRWKKEQNEASGDTAVLRELEISLESKTKELAQIFEQVSQKNQEVQKLKEELAQKSKENESIKLLKESVASLEKELRVQKGEVKRLKSYSDEKRTLKDLEERIEMERAQKSSLEKSTVELVKAKDSTIKELRDELAKMRSETYQGKSQSNEGNKEKMLLEEIRHLEMLVQAKDEEIVAYIEMDHSGGTQEFGDPDEDSFELSEVMFRHLLTKYVKLQRMMKTLKKEIRHRERENRIHELERQVHWLENEKNSREKQFKDLASDRDFAKEPVSPSNLSVVSTKSLAVGVKGQQRKAGSQKRSQRHKSPEEEMKEKIYSLEARLKIEKEDHERHNKNHQADCDKKLKEARESWESELKDLKHHYEREIQKIQSSFDSESRVLEETRSKMTEMEKTIRQQAQEIERRNARINELQHSKPKK